MVKLYTAFCRLISMIVPALLLSFNLSAQTVSSPVIRNPIVELIDSGFIFTEGPLWIDSTGLFFSDVRAGSVYLYSPYADTVTIAVPNSGNSNGLELDSTGALLLAQHGNRRIARLTPSGETSLASSWNGKRLNSPNDLTVKSDGSIFFTDPPYGVADSLREINFSGVYRIDPEGNILLLDSTITTPNGIAFSPDERVLYVNNSANRMIYRWEVLNDSAFGPRQDFVSVAGSLPGNADGMTVDSLGFLYATGSGGIWIIAPDGTVADTISIPGQLTNVTFGGSTRDTLYVTAASKLYRVYNSAIVGLGKKESKHTAALLHSPYPNPASGHVTIPVLMDKGGYVKLQVMDLKGNVTADITEGNLPAGHYTFSWNCGDVVRGMYLIKLSHQNGTVVRACFLK